MPDRTDLNELDDNEHFIADLLWVVNDRNYYGEAPAAHAKAHAAIAAAMKALDAYEDASDDFHHALTAAEAAVDALQAARERTPDEVGTTRGDPAGRLRPGATARSRRITSL